MIRLAACNCKNRSKERRNEKERNTNKQTNQKKGKKEKERHSSKRSNTKLLKRTDNHDNKGLFTPTKIKNKHRHLIKIQKTNQHKQNKAKFKKITNTKKAFCPSSLCLQRVWFSQVGRPSVFSFPDYVC